MTQQDRELVLVRVPARPKTQETRVEPKTQEKPFVVPLRWQVR